jgi:hypothetical protein
MSVKPDSTVLRTDYDATDELLRRVHSVSFDLRDIIEMIEALAAKGTTGSALANPPLRMRQICDGHFTHNAAGGGGGGGATGSSAALAAPRDQSGSGGGGGLKPGRQANAFFRSVATAAAESHAATVDAAHVRATRSSSFAHVLWDRALHVFRLLRHLGRSSNSVAVIEYRPGELLARIDAFVTELELLLLRSRSSKGGDDELCHQFVHGSCPRGASCSFSHGRGAVARWAQQWASEHMRDYSAMIALVRSGVVVPVQAPTTAQTGAGGIAGSAAPSAANPVAAAAAAMKLRRGVVSVVQSAAAATTAAEAASAGRPPMGAPRSSSDLAAAATTTSASGVVSNTASSGSFPASGTVDVARASVDAIARAAVFHPMCSGATLQIVDAIGPEALSLALDVLCQRDAAVHAATVAAADATAFSSSASFASGTFAASPSSGEFGAGRDDSVAARPVASSASFSSAPASAATPAAVARIAAAARDSMLHTIVVRHPPSRAVFDVLCTALAHGVFPRLRALDLSKASLASVGSHRIAKLARVVRRSAPSRAAAAASFESAAAAAASAPPTAPVRFQLDLGGNGLTNALVAHFCTSLAAAASPAAVPSLAVTTAPLDEHDDAAGSSGAAGPDELLHLDLGFNNVGPLQPDFSDFIAALCAALPFIEKLSLAGNPLVADGAARLFAAWPATAAAAMPSSSQPLAAPNVAKPSVGGGGALPPPQVPSPLPPPCAVRFLDLAGCGLGDRGASAVCAALRGQPGPGIRYLNLGWNGVTADGVVAIVELLRVRHSALACLRLDYSPAVGRRGAFLLSQALKENTALRRLDLRWCHVADEGLLAIAEALGPARNTTLAAVRFDRHDVDTRTVDLMQQKLAPAAAQFAEELQLWEVEAVW